MFFILLVQHDFKKKKVLCDYHEMRSCMKGKHTENNEYLRKKTAGYIG